MAFAHGHTNTGVDVDQVGARGVSPLIIASVKGHLAQHGCALSGEQISNRVTEFEATAQSSADAFGT